MSPDRKEGVAATATITRPKLAKAMPIPRPALRLLLLLTVSAASAEECPWLNSATASGALGGSISTVTVKHAKTGDDATCNFTRKHGSLVDQLTIETETLPSPSKDFPAYSARCSSVAAPLKGIGNEALACPGPATNDESAEQVVSRVRDRAFLVRIQTNDRSISRNDLRERTRKIAELVAGFLF
jgi:hypothetical protein